MDREKERVKKERKEERHSKKGRLIKREEIKKERYDRRGRGSILNKCGLLLLIEREREKKERK